VYLDRLGEERLKHVYPIRLMLDNGLRVAGGSDSPVTPPDSILGLHACVNAHHDDQRTSFMEALKIYTLEGAWLGFEEAAKGDLEAGMNADLIVLSDDPLTVANQGIRDIEVLLTMKGGRVVYDDLASHDLEIEPWAPKEEK